MIPHNPQAVYNQFPFICSAFVIFINILILLIGDLQRTYGPIKIDDD